MPCFPSLARAEKKLLRLAGEVARRAGGVSHPRIIPRGKQKGRYAPPHGEQNGHYGRRTANRRVVTPPWVRDPLRPSGARPPARRDSSFLAALTADILKFVKAGTLYYSIRFSRWC